MSPVADRPNTVPWPPVLYLAAIVAATTTQVLWPLKIPESVAPFTSMLGLLLLVGGVMVDVAAIRALIAARTTVAPHRRSDALVTTGPYSISRNPIYLGNTAALAGLALVFDMLWFLATVPVTAIAIQELAIKREERHLAARFGAEWERYAASVRRWL